jgi:acyl-CoA thioesterase YciA
MPNLVEQPEGEPLIRAIAMPADTNPSGDIFGGWLMAQMDLAGANAAVRRARGRCVTVAVDGMVFHEPVFVGDESQSLRWRFASWQNIDDNSS